MTTLSLFCGAPRPLGGWRSCPAPAAGPEAPATPPCSTVLWIRIQWIRIQKKTDPERAK